MVDPSTFVPLQLTVELVGAAVLLVVALVVVSRLIRLAYRVAIKVVVIATAAVVVLYALSLAGFDPVGFPSAVGF